MSITEIVDNLYMTEDKELFFKAYRLWCNILYGKYGISEELLRAFIKDIYEANTLYIDKENLIMVKADGITNNPINKSCRTTYIFDNKLRKFINENS